ncbi:MAG TPA: response regulator [Bacilli bacterium]|nr:response regulator [Bacilli bacterium]
MNEKGLIEQVLRVINKNYSNIYVIDILDDKVYAFDFTVANSLIIKNVNSYTDFIEVAKKFVHPDDLSSYFEALSLNKLEAAKEAGNDETKVKYRKLSEVGEYRWFVNIIDYLPFEGKRLIFMMSEDVNTRLVDSEEHSIKLESEVNNYKKELTNESESISNAIFQVNNLLDAGISTEGIVNISNTKDYINSVFKRVSEDHPELNKALINKMIYNTNNRRPAILIVDDSSIIRNSLKRIFDSDYEIVMAKNGQEAMDIIKSNFVTHESNDNIVGVLLDLLMPEVDGFQVLDYMKNHSLLTRIPVAIISGDETRDTRKKVYEYDIVDMLEKPFNTDVIRRRISKFINLYISSNNLTSLVNIQDEKIKSVKETNLLPIIDQVVDNVISTKESIYLSKMVRALAVGISNKYPNYKLDGKYIDAIVKNAPLYNIGAIAMPDDMVITTDSIKKEIENGIVIIDNYVKDEYEKNVTSNIIKYSCEMFNGSGYPNQLKGNQIPIEAQITNVMVRIVNGKGVIPTVKSMMESNKYNPDILDVLNDIKKDLKDIS